MSAAKLRLSPPLLTITLSILEAHLRQCPGADQLRQLHAQMTISGLIHDAFAAGRLLLSTASSPALPLTYSRRLLLRQLDTPTAFAWNALLRAHTRRVASHLCLPLYKAMLLAGSPFDHFTHPILLHACALRSARPEGEQVHSHAVKLGFDSDVHLLNTLIALYSACGALGDARRVFDVGPVRDSVSWNSILAAYVSAGDVEEAVRVFGRMPERNVIATNSLIDVYGKSGGVRDARELFDAMAERDVVSWTAMISCYEQNGRFRDAVELFFWMSREGVPADEVVMVSVLSACARSGAAREGEEIHGLIVRNGFSAYVNLHNVLIHMYSNCRNITAARQLFDSGEHLDQISWNSMISGYLKCGRVTEAKDIFDAMPQKDTVSWSTMISGYAQHDQFSETLALFHKMQIGLILPDETTLVSVMSACTHLSALEQGKWVHAYLKKNKYMMNVFIGTTLIDMYMKCGCVETALDVFKEMNDRGTSTWNAVILGLAMNGLIQDSLQKFADMEEQGVVPNEITFVGVLGACRHAGLVNEGRRHFDLMRQVYEIAPNIKHYGCMVDLLGRAGLLREAEELIESMPMVPDVATWGALLGACKKHGETEIGERVGRRLIELAPEHDGFHVLLSNIYASKGMWDDLRELRGTMRRRGVIKTPGCSMIESDGVVHEFLAGDRTHPRMKEIDKMLDEMARRLKLEGYKPDTTDVAFDIDEEEKETTLCRHSERLAIAFGLINTTPPVPIRIMKNLRICGDCHSAAKIISKVFEREIVVRDRQRFHHFKQGVCSCTDFW